jgi:GAF domain-containing protein/anti-sigma regulatory factor (Ser/Thr protein kinase)
MTEFGLARLQSILRVRLGLVAGVFALALGIPLRFGVFPSWFLVALSTLDLMATLLSAQWLRRWGAIRTVRIFLALDTLVIGAVVFSSGGIGGGLATLYALVPFMALLLLGRRDALGFALANAILFSLQAIWNLYEIRALPGNFPLVLVIAGQSAVLILVFAMMFVYAAVALGATRRLYRFKIVAELEHFWADQAQKRWTLVNDLALRMQECVTPEQIYSTVGAELERRDLHCAIFEWAVSDTAMHVSYVSLPAESLRRVLASLQIDLDTFQIPLADGLYLTKTVSERMPLLAQDPAHTAAALFGAIPQSLLEQIAEQFEWRCVVYAPMVYANQVNGVLAVFARTLAESDVAPFAALANQMATALEKERLLAEQRRRAAQLDTVRALALKITAERDLNELLHSIITSAMELVDADSATLDLMDEMTGELVVYISRNLPQGYSGWRLRMGEGLAGQVASSGEPLIVHDYAMWEGRLPQFPTDTLAGMMAVPLKWRTRVLGVIGLHRRRGRLPFNQEELHLAGLFAAQAAIAIENARLFQELQRHLKQVRTLHVASQALNSELDLEAVLERVAAQFVGALNVDSCTLSEWDRARNELVILVDLDSDLPLQVAVGKACPITDAFVQDVLNDQTAVALRLDEPGLDDAVRRYLETYAWQSLLLVPLVGKGQVIGLVELGDRKSKRSYSADEFSLAKSLAVQAAIAIENAKLYRSAQQRLREMEILYRYASELGGTLDIKTLGARALEAVGRLTDFDFGEVCLVREPDRALVPLVQVGGTNRSVEANLAAAGVGIIGWVAEHGRTVRLGDVTRDPRYVTFSEHTMSEICVPLRVSERTIGVLNLEAKVPNAFDTHTEQLLTVFAHQLASAIENARLYEQTKQDAEVKAVLLRELSHRVKNNFAAITSLLYLALDEQHETREQILSETLGRVQSMAAAHTLLARATDGYVDLLDIGAQVLRDTTRHLALPGVQIHIQTQGDHVQIAMRQLTTLALVLNELATNSLRHGWDETSNVPLVLRFVVTRQADQIAFYLQDNGKGLPADFNLNQRAGLGLTLVQSLVEKDLHGLFSIQRRDGWTSAEVRFRLEKDSV